MCPGCGHNSSRTEASRGQEEGRKRATPGLARAAGAGRRSEQSAWRHRGAKRPRCDRGGRPGYGAYGACRGGFTGPGRLLRLSRAGPSPAGSGAAVSPSPLVQFSGPTHASLMEASVRPLAQAHEQAHDHTPGARAGSLPPPLSDGFFTPISADSRAPQDRWHVTDARTYAHPGTRAPGPHSRRGPAAPRHRQTHSQSHSQTQAQTQAQARTRASTAPDRAPPPTARRHRPPANSPTPDGGRPPSTAVARRGTADAHADSHRTGVHRRPHATSPPLHATLRTDTNPAIPSGAP